MNATFQFKPEDVAKMDLVTRELMKVTGRDLPNVVRMTSIWFAKKVIRLTPIAPKKITTEFLWIQNKWVHTDVKRTFKPKGRGYAKAGWVKSLRGLGTSSQDSNTAWGNAHRFSSFTNALRKFAQPHVIMSNSIPYIETLNKNGNKRGTGANFLDVAMGKTIRQMVRLLDNHAKRIDQAWKRVMF